MNFSTAFLWNLFNGLFGNGIQPSIYQPLPPNNQSLLQQAQGRGFNFAGAFDSYKYNLNRGIGNALAGSFLGLGGLIDG